MKITEINNSIIKTMSVLNKAIYKDTIDQLYNLIEYWKKNFEEINTSHSNERKRFVELFNSIKTITTRNEFLERYEYPFTDNIFDAIDNMFSRLTYTDKSLEWSRLFYNIIEKTEMIGNIRTTEEKLNTLAESTIKMPYEVRFYILCFSFMLAMEGIYDELIRLIYATEKIIEGKFIPDYNKLKYEKIDKIKSEIKNIPHIISEIWNDGHHIRNAIAHSRFFYNPEDKRMRFIDINPSKSQENYDESFTYNQIQNFFKRIGVTHQALKLLLMLLQIFSLMTTHPKKILSYK